MKRTNNRLEFKIKDGYKLQLQTSGTMEVFGSTHTQKILTKENTKKSYQVLKYLK